jgi:hypothetical protein
MRILACILIVLSCCSGGLLRAQNLEKIGKKDMITIGGSMSLNSVLYDAYGFTPRRDPFTWYFSGSLNVSILDVSLPFTYSYSNRHGTYTQPFNMQSCSPKYKWIQAHVGTTALTYSPYTLGGHLFTGGAIELTPNGFYIGGMYGRLRKAVADDALSPATEEISYKRMGFAFKAGYESNGQALTVSYFHAADDPGSLLFVPPGADLFPMENAAIGISGKTTLWKVLNISGEFAASGLTRNIFSEEETTDYSGGEKWLLNTRTTTAFYKAWKASVAYSTNSFSIAALHEHVDPGYQTLGAYFFSNDLENYTLAPAFRFWKGKLSVSFNTGFQKNNLAGDRLSTTQRWIGSANIAFNPSKRWMMNAAYSNFTSYTRNRPNADPFWTPLPADTLSFYQIAQQANAAVSYHFGEKVTKQTFALIGSYQVTGQQQSGDVLPSTAIVNGNFTWNVVWLKSKWSLTTLANYNQSDAGTMFTQQFGPGVQLGKSFMQNRLRFSGGGVYNRSMTNAVLLHHVLSYRALLSFTPKVKNEKWGRPSFNANAVYVNKLPVAEGFEATGELTLTVNLAYSF